MAGVQVITCRLTDAVCFVIRGHLHCPCVVARSENGVVHVKQPTVCLHRVGCLQAGLATSDAYKLGFKDSCQWIWFVLQPCSDLRKCWNLSKSKIMLVYFFFSLHFHREINTIRLLIPVIAFTYKDTESVLQNCWGFILAPMKNGKTFHARIQWWHFHCESEGKDTTWIHVLLNSRHCSHTFDSVEFPLYSVTSQQLWSQGVDLCKVKTYNIRENTLIIRRPHMSKKG